MVRKLFWRLVSVPSINKVSWLYKFRNKVCNWSISREQVRIIQWHCMLYLLRKRWLYIWLHMYGKYICKFGNTTMTQIVVFNAFCDTCYFLQSYLFFFHEQQQVCRHLVHYLGPVMSRNSVTSSDRTSSVPLSVQT